MENECTCAWCGCAVQGEAAALCPECGSTYETEAQRPLHAHEERHPHND